MREEGLLAASANDEDVAFEAGLRPTSLSEFVGQADLKERLSILIEAARGRGDPLDHIVFSGPPGLGKTTLAAIIAAEMRTRLRVTSGPALERAGDLAAILSNLEAGDVMFIDEIHRLPRVVEEILYTAMEDFQLDIVVGKGAGAASIRLDLPPFTLVGATTRVGRMSAPLRDRFGYVARIDYYPDGELEEIVRRSATLLDVGVAGEAARVIASRSRGTPRVANRL
ncbi:MAG TPA: Holliday junction branch migration DNA helicase RuvB, partial [Acidimicrobiia bacterium]|nr:Holliday junction branch migration DNA helicase RuvB [Acidimicrobiia bacterium]